MSAYSSYKQKLQDPQWQKKRLTIMERDQWACRGCGDKESMLCVHHLEYKRGANPWEYPDDKLVTLCPGCHEDEHETRLEHEQSLLDTLHHPSILSGDVFTLMESFWGLIDKKRTAAALDVLYLLARKDAFYSDVVELFKKHRGREPGKRDV